VIKSMTKWECKDVVCAHALRQGPRERPCVVDCCPEIQPEGVCLYVKDKRVCWQRVEEDPCKEPPELKVGIEWVRCNILEMREKIEKLEHSPYDIENIEGRVYVLESKLEKLENKFKDHGHYVETSTICYKG